MSIVSPLFNIKQGLMLKKLLKGINHHYLVWIKQNSEEKKWKLNFKTMEREEKTQSNYHFISVKVAIHVAERAISLVNADQRMVKFLLF